LNCLHLNLIVVILKSKSNEIMKKKKTLLMQIIFSNFAVLLSGICGKQIALLYIEMYPIAANVS